jgi:hypothetical protein
MTKALGDFNKNRSKADGHQSYCRPCSRTTNNMLYREDEDFRRRIRQRNNMWRKELAKRIFEYLLEHPCVDCGERNPVLLHFDHLSDKVSGLADLVRHGHSWGKLITEIKKCEVRCANCHTLRTAKQFKWGSYKMALKAGFDMDPKLKN